MNSDYPEITEFLNIPYAEAPIGKLRFAAPVPVEKWYTSDMQDEILDGTEYGVICPSLNQDDPSDSVNLCFKN